jgi:hypothetical protein
MVCTYDIRFFCGDGTGHVRTAGFRVRSGFAIAVVIQGSARSWQVQACRKVLLCADDGPYARFPFHPLVEMEGSKAAMASRKAVAVVRRVARREMAALLAAVGPIDAAGVAGGSLIDPDAIANAHMRAHAKEGRLYRTEVAAALRRGGIAAQVLGDRDILPAVAGRHGLAPERLRDLLKRSGRGVFRPWSADEKLATLGALSQLGVAPPKSTC